MKQEKYLNPHQLQAVCAASAAVATPDTLPRICLVSGPPGTGKTKTVVRIVKQVLEVRAHISGNQNPIRTSEITAVVLSIFALNVWVLLYLGILFC